MSEIENEAKPYILHLSEAGQSIHRLGRKVLSEWLFLKFVVQVADPAFWTFDDKDLANFMHHRRLPIGYKAWIFVHRFDEARDSARVNAIHATFSGFPLDVAKDHQNLACYAHGFNQLLFFAMYAHKAPNVSSFPQHQAAKMYPLGSEGGLKLPELTLDADSVNYIFNFLPFNLTESTDFAYLTDVIQAGDILRQEREFQP